MGGVWEPMSAVTLWGISALHAVTGVAGGLAVWHWWFVVAHPQWWDR
ncbi:hypothetical protein [Saccharothrix deserti]|nr:hypothetical protein [Saccharothrix deserti]